MAYLGMSQYHGQMADEYDYDDVDDFYDNNHVNNNSNNYNDAADDSEGKFNENHQLNRQTKDFKLKFASQILRKRVSLNMDEQAEITANHLR